MILQNGQRSDEQRYHTFILDRIAMLISDMNETFIRRNLILVSPKLDLYYKIRRQIRNQRPYYVGIHSLQGESLRFFSIDFKLIRYGGIF